MLDGDVGTLPDALVASAKSKSKVLTLPQLAEELMEDMILLEVRNDCVGLLSLLASVLRFNI